MATNSVWRTIDLKTLSANQRTAWDAFQAANKIAGDKRKAFEKSYTDGVAVPEGMVLKLSYRFGLGVALLPKDEVRGKGTAKSATSLQDYIAAQAA